MTIVSNKLKTFFKSFSNTCKQSYDPTSSQVDVFSSKSQIIDMRCNTAGDILSWSGSNWTIEKRYYPLVTFQGSIFIMLLPFTYNTV
jgi:hypothetical protein